MIGLKKRRNELAKRLIDFCVANDLFNEPEMITITVDTIAWQLEYKWSLERLIQTLIVRASSKDSIDLEGLKELLKELQVLRRGMDCSEQ